MAIALAKEGGMGVVHKNLTIEAQAEEVTRVKRSANGIIPDPVTLSPDVRVGRAAQLMDEANVSGIPIVHSDQTLVGILTRRDLRFLEDPELPVSEVMTRENLVTAVGNVTLEEAGKILTAKRIEKLLLVDEDRKLTGLITNSRHRYDEAVPACLQRPGRGDCEWVRRSVSATLSEPRG